MKRTASQTQKIWMETIQAGIDQGLFVKDLDPVIVYRFMRDAIWMSVRWQHPPAGTPSTRSPTSAARCSSTDTSMPPDPRTMWALVDERAHSHADVSARSRRARPPTHVR